MGYLLVLRAKERRFEVVEDTSEDVYDGLARQVNGYQEYFTQVMVFGGEIPLYCNENGRLITPRPPLNAACALFYGGPVYGDVAAAISDYSHEEDDEGCVRYFDVDEAEFFAMLLNREIERHPVAFYDAFEKHFTEHPPKAEIRFQTFSSLDELQEQITKAREENSRIMADLIDRYDR